jgi:hypothetical protein
MNAYTTAGWESFFVAEVGAAAALTGLIFVAVSINLTRILAFPQLPGRAAETLFVLVGVLVTSTLALVPGQSRLALGAEILGVASCVWIAPMVLQRRVGQVAGAPRSWMVTRVATHQIATLPGLAAGVSLLAGAGGGFYWLVAGTVTSFAAAIVNAWVLLVEIQR